MTQAPEVLNTPQVSALSWLPHTTCNQSYVCRQTHLATETRQTKRNCAQQRRASGCIIHPCIVFSLRHPSLSQIKGIGRTQRKSRPITEVEILKVCLIRHTTLADHSWITSMRGRSYIWCLSVYFPKYHPLHTIIATLWKCPPRKGAQNRRKTAGLCNDLWVNFIPSSPSPSSHKTMVSSVVKRNGSARTFVPELRRRFKSSMSHLWVRDRPCLAVFSGLQDVPGTFLCKTTSSRDLNLDASHTDPDGSVHTTLPDSVTTRREHILFLAVVSVLACENKNSDCSVA